MKTAVLRCRVMAYITGVLIIVAFVGIPLQVVAHNTFLTSPVATVHGVLYIVYIIFAYILASKLHMKTLSLPKTSSMQLMPHVDTHEAPRRVGRVAESEDWQFGQEPQAVRAVAGADGRSRRVVLPKLGHWM
jgi:integral membrane protein